VKIIILEQGHSQDFFSTTALERGWGSSRRGAASPISTRWSSGERTGHQMVFTRFKCSEWPLQVV